MSSPSADAAYALSKSVPARASPARIIAALLAEPMSAAAWTALGSVHRAARRDVEALRCHDRALAVDPGHANAHFNRANALSALDRIEPAGVAYRRAVALAPERPERWLNLAHVDRLAGRRVAAAGHLRRALRLASGFAQAWASLAGLSDAPAARHCRRAAQVIAPDLAAILLKLAGDARDDRAIDAAVVLYRRAFRVDQTPTPAMSDYLTTLLFATDADGATLAREHRRIGRLIEAPFVGRRPAHANQVDPERPLRLGVIAPTFRRHVSNASLLPAFEALDRRSFELHLFAHLRHPDEISERYRALAAGWHRIDALDDDDAATLIRAAGIDILIHPLGHWPEARVGILARKPAPLLVAYMMNAPTMGLTAVDATLVDPLLDPRGDLARQSVERPLTLAGSYALVLREDDLPIDPRPPRARRGHVTFGSFNDPGKINPGTLALWSRVLAGDPSARLVVKGVGLARAAAAERLRGLAAAAGLDPRRIDCLGPSPTVRDHLELIDGIDVMLDTVPFPGGSTTVDALWMGVPVVAMIGDHPMRRAGAAVLSHAGATELIARDGAHYVEIARALAADVDRLIAYRAGLRARLRASPLMDAPRHAREIEAGLRALWRDWCASPARA